MILGGIGEKVNDFLYLSFALMKPRNIFKFDVNIFGHLKVFSFVESPSKPLPDVLSVRALVDEGQDNNE